MYNLFISHSWSYSEQYKKLKELLDSDSDFLYNDCSIPEDDPIHDAPNELLLKEKIKEKMKDASCVLVLAGVYSSYSKWINIEIELAKELNKKIIAIEYWGAENTSTVVKEAADFVVKWNSESIITAIKKVSILNSLPNGYFF